MPSELERIANRLRHLSSQADQYRATIYRASQGFTETAQTIAAARYPSGDGVERKPPAQLVGRLMAAGRGAERAIGPLTVTAMLLRNFATSLVATGGGRATAQVAVGGGTLPGSVGGTVPDHLPPGTRPSAAASAMPAGPAPVLAPPEGQRVDPPDGQRVGRHRARSLPPTRTPAQSRTQHPAPLPPLPTAPLAPTAKPAGDRDRVLANPTGLQ